MHNLTWKETKSLLKTWFRWDEGRQKTGYDGFLLLLNPFFIPWHVVLLRFKLGAHIPPHKDVVKGKKHYRLNLIIWQAKKGGEFVCEKPIYQSKYLNFLRSDLSRHEVRKVEKGTRYVLSIGWVLK
jgi:hypothetical protein